MVSSEKNAQKLKEKMQSLITEAEVLRRHDALGKWLELKELISLGQEIEAQIVRKETQAKKIKALVDSADRDIQDFKEQSEEKKLIAEQDRVRMLKKKKLNLEIPAPVTETDKMKEELKKLEQDDSETEESEEYLEEDDALKKELNEDKGKADKELGITDDELPDLDGLPTFDDD